MTVHAKHPFPDTPEEIAATRRAGARPELPRPGVGAAACTSTTATACAWGRARSSCGRNSGCEDDAAHAFYMGVELAHAELAWRLGKRYVQDQPLDWGCAVEAPAQDLNAWCAPGTTLATQGAQAHDDADEGATDDERHDLRDRASPRSPPTAARTSRRWACATRASQVVLMPFKPSTTLDNVLATGHAVLNLVTDTRVFAGCVTGRRDWPTLPAEKIAGVRLASALGHVELRAGRAASTMRSARCCAWRACTRSAHAPFMGFNRAQARGDRGRGAGQPAAHAAAAQGRQRDGLSADRDRQDRRARRARGLGLAARRGRGAPRARRRHDAAAGQRAQRRRGAAGRRRRRRLHRPEGAGRRCARRLAGREHRAPSSRRCAGSGITLPVSATIGDLPMHALDAHRWRASTRSAPAASTTSRSASSATPRRGAVLDALAALRRRGRAGVHRRPRARRGADVAHACRAGLSRR